MFREEHDQYEVNFWMNRHDTIECKVIDTHSVGEKCIAHLVEKDNVNAYNTTGWYSSMQPEIRRAIRTGNNPRASLMRFEEIDRDAPEHSENTMYWKLATRGFWWARMPLSSWESAKACGEFVQWEVLWGEDNLIRIIKELREKYMSECREEAAPSV